MHKTTIAAVLAACAITAAPVESSAQSESAIAGWIGLITTPVGALTPLAPTGASARAEMSIGAQARYAHWQFDEDDDNTTNLGAGLVIRRGALRTAIEVGRISVKNCDDCGGLMAGIDLHLGMLERAPAGPVTLSLGINPALGFGDSEGSDDDATSIAGALSVPVSLSIMGGGVRVVPFVSPGFGFARVSGGDDSFTGSRAMLSGGVGVAGVNMPVQLTLSARKIFLEDAPTIIGVGLAIGR